MSSDGDSGNVTPACIICNVGSGDDNFISSKKSLLSQQLNGIFLLRTILEVPKTLLEGFFSDGEHPSEWGILSLCENCGEEITKCKSLFDEMMKVQKRFKEKKKGIIGKIKGKPNSPSAAKSDRKLVLREKCLNFVIKNDYSSIENPFPLGDLQASKLLAFVKQEVDVEDHSIDLKEEALEEIRGDFEVLEVEWIVPSELAENEEDEDGECQEDEEISSDSDYKPEENYNLSTTKPSSTTSSPPKRKRGRPKRNEAIGGTKSSISRTRMLTNKQGLLPPAPPNNPDPLTLISCPNCENTKFQKSRGDLLYGHLVNCIESSLNEETYPWNCPLCKIEVICYSSSTTPSSKPDHNHCLRFVEHLNTCQAPNSKIEQGPFPLSSRLFYCDLCYPLQDGPLFTFPHFLDHCKFHKKFIYQCNYPQCPPTSRFSTIYRLKAHWKTYHNDSSIDPSTSIRHTISSILPTLQFWCSHCHLHFPSSDLLSQHLISSHPDLRPCSSPQTCEYCSKVYSTPSLLSLHETESHLEEKYFLKCSLCQTYHPSTHSLALHEKSRKHQKNLADNPIVDPQGSKVCEICGQTCDDIGEGDGGTSLQKHMRIYHPSKKVRPSRSGPVPKPTKMVDSKGRSLQCPQCNKGFSQLNNLNLHVRTIHEGNWPYYCHSCGKGLATKPALKKHLAATHGEGEYGMFICQFEGCGKKFSNNDIFQGHLNRHKGEKMFGCEYCGKAFFRMKYLQDHLLIHTNPDDKPFQCEICPHKFRVKGHLKMHMNLHKKKGDC